MTTPIITASHIGTVKNNMSTNVVSIRDGLLNKSIKLNLRFSMIDLIILLLLLNKKGVVAIVNEMG